MWHSTDVKTNGGIVFFFNEIMSLVCQKVERFYNSHNQKNIASKRDRKRPSVRLPTRKLGYFPKPLKCFISFTTRGLREHQISNIKQTRPPFPVILGKRYKISIVLPARREKKTKRRPVWIDDEKKMQKKI